jgi:hypothetical protein
VVFRIIVLAVVLVGVVALAFLMGSSNSAKAAYLNGIVVVLTLGFVCMQLVLAYEQVVIANRQTKILERQDALLYGVVVITVYSPDVANIGSDELVATAQVRLIVRNSGNKVARGARLRMKVPLQFEPGDETWTVYRDTADSRSSIWERVDMIAEVPPGLPLPPIVMSLKRMRFEPTAEPLRWNVVYDGGTSPALGNFADLKATEDD